MGKYRGRKPGQLLDEFYPWAMGREFSSLEVAETFGVSHGRAVAFLRRLRAYGNVMVGNKRTFAGKFMYALTQAGEKAAEYRKGE
jgi:hypothetical protein